MIQEVEKSPKVALCRKCHGRGRLHDRDTGAEHECYHLEGTGRATISAKMTYDIRPYKPRDRH